MGVRVAARRRAPKGSPPASGSLPAPRSSGGPPGRLRLGRVFSQGKAAGTPEARATAPGAPRLGASVEAGRTRRGTGPLASPSPVGRRAALTSPSLLQSSCPQRFPARDERRGRVGRPSPPAPIVRALSQAAYVRRVSASRSKASTTRSTVARSSSSSRSNCPRRSSIRRSNAAWSPSPTR